MTLSRPTLYCNDPKPHDVIKFAQFLYVMCNNLRKTLVTSTLTLQNGQLSCNQGSRNQRSTLQRPNICDSSHTQTIQTQTIQSNQLSTLWCISHTHICREREREREPYKPVQNHLLLIYFQLKNFLWQQKWFQS